MKNKKILEKAIQKAIDGGYLPTMRANRIEIEMKEPWKFSKYRLSSDWYYTIKDLIFNHDFAKALWTGNIREIECIYSQAYTNKNSKTKLIYDWQYHLQQMVISENPIKYLGENI